MFNLHSCLTTVRYTQIQIGVPPKSEHGEPSRVPQTLEVDIDMLNPDFYTIMTQSGRGSKYDTFLSTTHGVPLTLMNI